MKDVECLETANLTVGHVRFMGFTRRSRAACLLTAAMAFTALHAAGQTSVLTQHNDVGRTGQNTNETILNTTNVNVSSFGQLFSLPVQGQVYAQPLYVYQVKINGVFHNVLIVATEEDNVYAFDADTPAAPLWSASLVDQKHGAGAGETAVPSSVIGCTDLLPSIGVTSTPVIDSVAGFIYVEAKSTDGTNFFHRLHALNLATGAESSQGPAVIAGTVSGTGDGSNNGQVTFDAFYENNRPGLLLLNGSVYIGFASHCDNGPYHGWLFAYNATSLVRQSVFVTTPNGGLGGIWMSGSGLAADANYIYTASGNGSFDTTNVPATELGDTVMKLGTTGGNLSLQDYFTPSDQNCLANNDFDLGSGGVLVLPDQPGVYQHILVAGGKEGAIYVVNRDQMTKGNNHFENSNNCITNDPQILEESASGAFGTMFSLPAYWNSTLYYGAAGDVMKSIPLVNGLPDLSATTTNSLRSLWPGTTPSISSNGTVAHTGILWAIENGSDNGTPLPGIVYAFDAMDISTELWDSTQAPGNRDVAGVYVKFSVPTVVNGKVYVGATNLVNVYGLLQGPATLTSPTPGTTLPGPTVTFSWLPAAGATNYEFQLGSSGVGSSDLYNSGTLSPATTSKTVTLPINGTKIYARLLSMISGAWQSVDYTYTAASQAVLTTPAPTTVLAGSAVTFTWTAGTGNPTGYSLWLGSTGVGSNNLYDSGEKTVTSVTAGGLPANGEAIFARLYTSFGKTTVHNDYAYTAAMLAAMTSPAAGSVLSSPNVTFSWSSATGATGYSLWLGSTGVGSNNLYNSGNTTNTSAGVSGLPTYGETIYARLLTNLNGNSLSVDYTYKAANVAQSALTSPTPGSTLTGTTVTFSWTASSGARGYSLWLGSTGVGSNNLYDSGETTGTSATAKGLPANGGTIYARFNINFNGVSQHVDYIYTAAP